MNSLKTILLTSAVLCSGGLFAQSNEQILNDLASLKNHNSNLEHTLDALTKKVDDLLWYEKLGDLAYIDKVYLTGEPKANPGNTIRGYFLSGFTDFGINT